MIRPIVLLETNPRELRVGRSRQLWSTRVPQWVVEWRNVINLTELTSPPAYSRSVRLGGPAVGPAEPAVASWLPPAALCRVRLAGALARRTSARWHEALNQPAFSKPSLVAKLRSLARASLRRDLTVPRGDDVLTAICVKVSPSKYAIWTTWR
jgi:hypothetical protein